MSMRRNKISHKSQKIRSKYAAYVHDMIRQELTTIGNSNLCTYKNASAQFFARSREIRAAPRQQCAAPKGIHGRVRRCRPAGTAANMSTYLIRMSFILVSCWPDISKCCWICSVLVKELCSIAKSTKIFQPLI